MPVIDVQTFFVLVIPEKTYLSQKLILRIILKNFKIPKLQTVEIRHFFFTAYFNFFLKCEMNTKIKKYLFLKTTNRASLVDLC